MVLLYSPSISSQVLPTCFTLITVENVINHRCHNVRKEGVFAQSSRCGEEQITAPKVADRLEPSMNA